MISSMAFKDHFAHYWKLETQTYTIGRFKLSLHKKIVSPTHKNINKTCTMYKTDETYGSRHCVY